MEDKHKNIDQLVQELESMRKRIAELELQEGEREHKEIEEVLSRFCESTYSTIFNAASDGIFITDIETGNIIDVNAKACEMFCYPKEEMLKLRIYGISLNEEQYTEGEMAKFLGKAAEGEPQLFEWAAKDKAGRPFWVEVNLRRAIVGGKYHLLAVVRDISERKKLEESLAKINETFLAFGPDSVENINHLTALCGELLGADCALYNRLEDNVLSSCGQWKVPEDFNPKTSPEGHICYDVIRRQEPGLVLIRNLQESEYAKSDPNVTLYNLQTYLGCPVKFSGEYVGSLCVLYQYDFEPAEDDREVMEIIASAIGVEEERRSAEEVSHLARFSIDKASDSMFWIGKDARILYVNEVCCELLGYTQDELLSMSVYDIDPNYSKDIWPGHWKELKERGSFSIETAHRKKDGTLIPVEVGLNYLEYEGVEYNFAFARDITKRKRQEGALLKRDYQLEILSRTSQHINAVLEIPIIMRTLVTAAMELVDGTGGTAGIFDNGKLRFTEYIREGKVKPIDYSFEKSRVLPGWVIDTLKPYIANDAERDAHVSPEMRQTFGLYNLVSVPILNRKGELLGCFEIHNKEGRTSFAPEDVFMLQGLAASAAVALENAKMFIERKKAEAERVKLNRELTASNKRLEKLALKDTMTGLYNHQYLVEVIEAEFYRSRRYGHPISVVMLDIDYFKSINDLYGHEFGDLVLRQFATYLRKMVRKYDVVVRYGGEEFVIISPGVDKVKVQVLAQRVLDAVGLYNFGNKKQVVKLKLSVAVSSYPDPNITKGIDLINSADKILSKVKAAGGNRVFSAYDLAKKKGAVGQEIPEPTDVRFLKERIEKLNVRGKQSLIEFIFAFAKTIELKDHYTGEHVENTVHYATEIAKALKLPSEEIENIREASVLHDLGKIGISDKMLHKKSKLTAKEFEAIKKHPQIAADIIRPIQFMHDIVPLVLYHHERWDGKGYPAGLKAEEIPMGARIIAVADVYQALTSNRPYRKAFPHKEAIKMIKNDSGTHFDPSIVDIFLGILKKEKKGK